MLKVFSGIKWALIVTILLLKTTVLAQDFEVAPITLNFAVEPGDMESQIITVRNHGSPGSNAKYFAKISKLVEISKPQDSLRVFNVEKENTGDNRIDCKLYLVASNLETASESKTNPVQITMLPEEIRTVELKLPADLLPGPYSLAAILDYGHRTNLEAVQMQIDIK